MNTTRKASAKTKATLATTQPGRVLIISHAHPDHSLGGGEIAAHSHWAELRRQGDESLFLARTAMASGRAGTPFISRASDDSEVLFYLTPVDHFKHSQTDRKLIHEDFRGLLEQFKPTAVHLHHYVHMGLEMIREIRKFAPDIPIFLTLHDYLGICHAQGQMIKTNGMLCQRATPMDCNACYPNHSPQDFFMRELFVKSFFNLVDVFVSPSHFLRDRYVAWGLPAEKFMVLENGQAPVSSAQGNVASTDASQAIAPMHTRFLVLGQLSKLKGTLVLLDAIRSLPPEVAKRVRIEIHGSIQHAEESFKTAFLKGCEELAPTLRYCGPYLPQDVNTILQSGGWLIVPSIWWENSPMVIQESLRARRPVIASNIGGMSEKVQHGVTGLHFRAGSASDLARRIEEAADSAEFWEKLSQGITPPPSLQTTVQILRGLYALPRQQLSQALVQATPQASP
jgi:glycosyltransferase involved in cell wall biosynthesis